MVAPGQVFGDRYVIEALLGRGGMAEVYRARDVAADRTVAVKALRVEVTDARRFDAETQLLARLDHRNLVRLLDSGQRAGGPYLVLELVDGPTVAERVARGPLAVDDVRRLGEDIARALTYVHAQGVIHRDVKPSNILLPPDGRALLADFGVARVADGTRLTEPESMIGTAAYLAPEQLGPAEVTGAADVYALGLVLVEALSGRPAFTGTPQEMLAARVARDPWIPPALPRPWTGLLHAMTARDPAARPDAAAIAAGLAAPAGRLADVTMAVPRRRAPTTASEHRPMRWLLAAVAAVLGALVVGSAATRDAVDESAGADPDSDRTSADRALDPAAPTTTIPPTTETTLSSGSPTKAITAGAVPGRDPRKWAAGSCADLEARTGAIDGQTLLNKGSYRDDRGSRERPKQQLKDERRAFTTLAQALGC
jgi:eukaryotic-like serine/threonine-protein kinase